MATKRKRHRRGYGIPKPSTKDSVLSYTTIKDTSRKRKNRRNHRVTKFTPRVLETFASVNDDRSSDSEGELSKKRRKVCQRALERLNGSDTSDMEPGCLDIRPIKCKDQQFRKHNNYNNIPSHPNRCLFVGATGSGKTTGFLNLVTRDRYLRNFYDEIHIFSPNVFAEQQFGEVKKRNPRAKVYEHEQWDESFVRGLLNKARDLSANAKSKRKDSLPRVLIIVDDFGGNAAVMRSPALTDAFFMSRKYFWTLWLSVQAFRSAHLWFRLNCEHLVIHEQGNKEVEKISDEVSQGMFTKDRIIELMQHVAEVPYSFLFINRKKRTNDGRYNFTYKYKLKLNQACQNDHDLPLSRCGLDLENKKASLNNKVRKYDALEQRDDNDGRGVGGEENKKKNKRRKMRR